MAELFIALGALTSGLAVVLGAFGAHALRARLSVEKLSSLETGIRYQFYHGLGLIGVGLTAFHLPGVVLVVGAGWLFVLGTLLFCGSIYWLVFTGPRWLGPVTPLGGLALIGGWILLAVSVLL